MFVYVSVVETATPALFKFWLWICLKSYPTTFYLCAWVEWRNTLHLLLWVNRVIQIHTIRITNLFGDCVSVEATV